LNNKILRISQFIIAIPLFIIFILYLPQANHLAIVIIGVIANLLATLELSEFLGLRKNKLYRFFSVINGLFFPVGSYLLISGYISTTLLMSCVLILLGIYFGSEIFSGSEHNFKHSLNSISKIVFALFYPGFFMAMIFLILSMPSGSELLLLMVSMVYLNDSFAWFSGMLLGKNNRGLIKVSPNKSLAGFIGGIAASVFAVLVSHLIMPELINGNILQLIIFGIIIGITVITGDLFESVVKRSANIKDSGTYMMGRGGMLDSIDSLVFAGAFFSILYRLVFLGV